MEGKQAAQASPCGVKSGIVEAEAKASALGKRNTHTRRVAADGMCLAYGRGEKQARELPSMRQAGAATWASGTVSMFKLTPGLRGDLEPSRGTRAMCQRHNGGSLHVRVLMRRVTAEGGAVETY